VMQSYAAGLALAEQVIHGEYQTFDAKVLSGTRFDEGRWIHENLVI